MSQPQPILGRATTAALLLLFAVIWAAGEALVVHEYRFADGEPGLSLKDLELKFTGGYGSLLEARIHGEMRPYLQSPAELALLSNWARNGASETGYRQDVAQLLEERCVRCHRAGGQAAFMPLGTFRQAVVAAKARSVPPFAHQMIVTKIHLFGIGLMLAVVAALFLRATGRRGWAAALVVTGYAGLAMDFGGWWLMRWDLSFAVCRVVGNVAATGAFAFMVVVVALKTAKEPHA